MFPTVEHVMVWFTGLVGLKCSKMLGLRAILTELNQLMSSWCVPNLVLVIFMSHLLCKKPTSSGNKVGNLIQNDIIVKKRQSFMPRSLGLCLSR